MAVLNVATNYVANSGVTTATYVWKLNGVIQSETSNTFFYTPTTTASFTLQVRANSTCDSSTFESAVKTYTVDPVGNSFTTETIDVTLSTSNNFINYDQFPDVTPPAEFHIGSGHGFPQFIETGSGLINTLKKGFTYSNNASAYEESRIPSSRSSVFKTTDGPGNLENKALSVSNDFASDPVLSTAKYIHNSFGNNFSLVSSTAAVLVGQYYQPASSFKPNSTNCSSNWYNNIGYMMFDSEIYSDDGNWHRVMWNIIQGIKVANTSIVQILFYGRWASGFLQTGSLSAYYGVGDKMTFSSTVINNWITTPSAYRWEQYRSNMSKVAVDLGQYFREPLPIAESLYLKDGSGNYILSGGKRQIRTDDFTETVYNHTNEYLAAPHNEIRYRYNKNTGGQAVAPSAALPADFDGWSTNETQYRDPAQYRTSPEWALEGIYRLHDLMQDGLRSIRYSNFTENDISYYRSYPSDRPGAVFCPNTEPFTYGGNHWVRRWIGPEQLKWMYVDALFSGIYSIEMWRDGTGGEFGLASNVCPEPTAIDSNNNPTSYSNYIIKAQGNALYPAIAYDSINVNNFNFAEVVTGTVNKVIQLYQGITFDNTLKYGSFSIAMISARDKEILGKYFYQGNKLTMYLWNPWNDITDNTTVNVYLGSQTHSIILSGRNLKIVTFDITGLTLNNNTIKISYNNIDGIERKVTGNILNHNW